MERNEIERLIGFHQDGLDQYRQHISPSAQYLEEQTIKALKELDKVERLKEESDQVIKRAKEILGNA